VVGKGQHVGREKWHSDGKGSGCGRTTSMYIGVFRDWLWNKVCYRATDHGYITMDYTQSRRRTWYCPAGLS